MPAAMIPRISVAKILARNLRGWRRSLLRSSANADQVVNAPAKPIPKSASVAEELFEINPRKNEPAILTKRIPPGKVKRRQNR